MPTAKSTRRRTSAKSVVRSDNSRPKRPYPASLFSPHRTGRWCKRINRTLYYFGRIADDPEATAALEKLNRELPYLKRGEKPPPVDTSNGLTLGDLVNVFLNSKREKLDAGELTRGTFRGYLDTCVGLTAFFGKERRVESLRPDDFERLRSDLAKKLGVVSLRNEVNKTRILFKHALKQKLIKEEISYGESFDRPSQLALRKARNAAGPRLFTAEELRSILNLLEGKPVKIMVGDEQKQVRRKADPVTRAMVLLGINAAFGNTDVASLPQSALVLDRGWVVFPRPKTEVARTIPLWPETVAALRKALAVRPEPKSPADDGLCFITIQGNRWVRHVPHSSGKQDRYVKIDTVGARFQLVLDKLGINGRRGFYTLRHTFATISGEAKDQIATNAVMGHVDSSVPGMYRENVSDDRLLAVVNHVRAWLFQSRKTSKNGRAHAARKRG